MVIWDFNENKNYIKKYIKGYYYKVLNLPDALDAAKLLNEIAFLSIKAIMLMYKTEITTDEINILYTTPHLFQEMQLLKDQGSIKFEGLNKPKKVVKTNKPSVGEDGRFRAKYRIIFLTIRNEKGKLKTIKQLEKLIAHELTHTAMNHVTWKDNNHDKKFKEYNKLILRHIKLVN
tara:strand:+ start:139 stop:663 length:525 start_codon:yes stop_codon:yes gene_type:complete